jgi:hypothetical protein
VGEEGSRGQKKSRGKPRREIGVTTIAYKDGVLAGDTLADRGGLAHLVDSKVFALADGRLFGGCGSFGQVLAVKTWLDGGEKPAVDDFSGIVVELDGSARILESSLQFVPVPFPWFAIGSGRDFAIAAMHLGRTALQAVELAAEYDTYTGGQILMVDLPWARVA